MDWIRVEGLAVRCIVGLRSYERHREQPINLDVALGLDLSSAGRTGSINESADYSRVADETAAILRFREYRLLEVAAEELAAYLFAAHPTVRQLELKLGKPEALGGRARTAAIEIERSRGAFGTAKEETPYGTRVVLLDTPEASVESLTLLPNQQASFNENARRLECQVERGDSGTQPHPGPQIIEHEVCSSYSAEQKPLHVVRCVMKNIALSPIEPA